MSGCVWRHVITLQPPPHHRSGREGLWAPDATEGAPGRMEPTGPECDLGFRASVHHVGNGLTVAHASARGFGGHCRKGPSGL